MSETTEPTNALAPVGITGLDDILRGGLPCGQIYLVEGNPGTGKTTLSMQFLLEGVRRGETVLYITLSETEKELHKVAQSHGWSLDGVKVFEMVPTEDALQPDRQYTMYHAAEVELSQTTAAMLAEVERLKPSRIVLDSLSEMRLLAQNSLRYRRQVLALKQFFAGREATVLLLDDRTADVGDRQVESIAHGVLSLEEMHPDYGSERRRLRVAKLRGMHYRGGYHDFMIRRGGLEVFPRLIAVEHNRDVARKTISSGIGGLDLLLGGGLHTGSSALLMGPAGCGKSSIAAQYAGVACADGDPVAIYAFEESVESICERAKAFGIELDPHLRSGRLTIQQIDPAELSPGEFVHSIRDAVDKRGVRVVIVDSLNGYLAAMPEERLLIVLLHELLTYLNRKEVLSLMIVAQHGLVGNMRSPVDLSYLADAIVLLRYFEHRGEVSQAISVLKKRQGRHERTIRELKLEEGGINVGEPLRGFHGILTGVPTLVAPQPPQVAEAL